jgi:hypothetical protein
MPRAVQGYLVAGITTTQPEITQRDLRNRGRKLSDSVISFSFA